MSAEDSWDISFVDIDRLQEKMMRIPELSEKIINDVLVNSSEVRAPQTMRKIFPISKRNPTRPITLANKKQVTVGHAKTSESLKVTHENLGFTVRPKPNWRYLVYPDLGLGGRNPLEQEFMRRGMEREVPTITAELEAGLEQGINKELGGISK